jgi:hypothetical protein
MGPIRDVLVDKQAKLRQVQYKQDQSGYRDEKEKQDPRSG